MERAAGPCGDALRLEESPLAGLSTAQLDSLANALAAVAISAPPTEKKENVPAAPVAPTRDELISPLLEALAKKHPLCLKASGKAGTLVVVVSGRASPRAAQADESADALLREHVLPLICGDNALLPGDNVRLVLDLRALAFFPREAAAALLERWGAFAASRCFAGRIAVVMPSVDDCSASLRTAAAETRLSEACRSLRTAVLARARDVAAFFDAI